MRAIDEYMKLPYKMGIVPDTEEGGYVVSFSDLPGCLTVGDTIKNVEAAKWLDKESLYSGEWLPADISLIEKISKKL